MASYFLHVCKAMANHSATTKIFLEKVVLVIVFGAIPYYKLLEFDSEQLMYQCIVLEHKSVMQNSK